MNETRVAKNLVIVRAERWTHGSSLEHSPYFFIVKDFLKRKICSLAMD